MTDQEVDRLRAALQAIIDYEPDYEVAVIDNDSCVECPKWANHSMQQMCHEHMRQWYRASDNRDRMRNSQHLELRAIAREALTFTPTN